MLPVLTGIIARRILLNFRAPVEAVRPLVPAASPPGWASPPRTWPIASPSTAARLAFDSAVLMRGLRHEWHEVPVAPSPHRRRSAWLAW